MNHLGDTNKMVSDTPRTNDQIGYDGSTMSAIRIEFCRQLERELNAANVEIEEKHKDVVWLATEKVKLENYVMLLEDAGDELVGTADAMDAWRKAKEAKL